MDRFGIGYEALRAINPRLIYCAVSGFGQNGPERGTAAFDGKLQAMSGIMSITGHEDKGPTRAGFALCDTIGGMTAAFAVASALFQRSQTGEGQFVDVAMLDAALASSRRRSPNTPSPATGTGSSAICPRPARSPATASRPARAI